MSTILYEDTKETPYIQFTRFYGGKDKGISIQITLGDQYKVLNSNEVKDLISKFNKFEEV